MTFSRNQGWDPRAYSDNARFVSDLGAPVLELLAPQSGERILDLGCGDGALTAKLVESGCEVVAVDASPEMVAATRARGLEAHVADGRALGFESEFDAVFGNAALHWMKPHDLVIAGVWCALKPGGRFVGECGGYGNIETIQTALEAGLRKRGLDPDTVNPWSFPMAGEFRHQLERRGFTVQTITLFRRPTPLPGDIVGWLITFAKIFMNALPAADRQEFLQEVAQVCRAKLCDAHGNWTADYVRLRFCAIKPRSAA